MAWSLTKAQLIVLTQAVTQDEATYHYRSPDRTEALSLVELGLLERLPDTGDWENFKPTAKATKSDGSWRQIS